MGRIGKGGMSSWVACRGETPELSRTKNSTPSKRLELTLQRGAPLSDTKPTGERKTGLEFQKKRGGK